MSDFGCCAGLTDGDLPYDPAPLRRVSDPVGNRKSNDYKPNVTTRLLVMISTYLR